MHIYLSGDDKEYRLLGRVAAQFAELFRRFGNLLFYPQFKCVVSQNRLSIAVVFTFHIAVYVEQL